MSNEPLRIELSCPVCSWRQECGEHEVAGRLRAVGMLKRNPHPTRLELRELVMAAAGRMACSNCGQVGLLATDAPDESDLWPSARRCSICGRVIPAERLEVFPAAATCVACQNSEDQGRVGEQAEYCPKCGAPLVVRQTRGQGITRYTRSCSATPPCRL